MKIFLVVLLAAHGAIHLIGFAKAFGLAQVAQLQQPIGRGMGLLWLAAGLAMMVSAVLLVAAPRAWWLAALPAIVLSQIAIVSSWGDAKFGTAANLIVLVPLSLALLDLRPSSLSSTFDREVARALARSAPAALVTERDLSPLPPLVQAYLRRAGVVGRPRVRDFHARFRAQMKSKPDAAWMEARVEQVETFDPPARMFKMDASRFGIPFEALHLYVGPNATMRVRVASLFDVVDARGAEMDRSETVTLFNDMCLLAPATLIGAAVEWQTLDARTVGATFTNAGHTIRARLHFDESGDLTTFTSEDRAQSADGKSYRNLPWSTPVRDYRDYGGARLAAHGDAVWREAEGDFVYGRFELEEIHYNVGSEAGASPVGAVPLSAASAPSIEAR